MLHDLTAADLDGMPALDLVRAAVASQPDFKVVSAALDRRPANPVAAEFLVAAFARGETPPWLTAHLLGQLRAAVGYDTVRGILLAAPGSLAESYAGHALAKIRGEEAAPDLVHILNTAPKARSREGAAYGLGALGTREAAGAILDAAAAGRIRASTGGAILGELPFDQARVASAILSGDERMVSLGMETAWSMARAGTDAHPQHTRPPVQPHPCLIDAVRQALADPRVHMAPLKRRALEAWVPHAGTGGASRDLAQCPCCDYFALDSRGEYEICPVCFWEDDGIGLDDLDRHSGPNHMTLGEARINFQRIGACDDRALAHVVSGQERLRFVRRAR